MTRSAANLASDREEADAVCASEADELRELLVSMYSPEEIIEWLWAPHQRLGSASAMVLIFAGRRAKVLEVLRQLNEGAFI